MLGREAVRDCLPPRLHVRNFSRSHSVPPVTVRPGSSTGPQLTSYLEILQSRNVGHGATASLLMARLYQFKIFGTQLA